MDYQVDFTKAYKDLYEGIAAKGGVMGKGKDDEEKKPAAKPDAKAKGGDKKDGEGDESAVKQAVYDIRYRAKREGVPVAQAMTDYLKHSASLGPKARAELKKKLLGEENVEEAYTVTAADKKGNTKAYQNYKAGMKGKDGKPLYKAADHMKEEDQVDEAMRPGPRREKMRAKMHDPYVRGGSKSRGQAHNIAVRGDVSTGDPAIKSRGGGGVEKDKGMGYGDRGAGNKARRRAGQEPMRGNTRTEEVEMKKDQKSDGRDTPTKVKLALARLRAKGMKVASPIVAPSNRDTAELPPLGEGINAYPASLRARTMGMSKADRQKHFDAYDAKKKGEEKKVSEGVVKKDYIGPLYAAWQDVIAGNPNTAAKFEEGIGIDQQMKISQDYNRMSPEEKLAANKKAMGNVKKVAPKKDTRTDAEKMTDAVGKPRMGSSD